MERKKGLDRTLLVVLIAIAFLAWGFYPSLYGIFSRYDNEEQETAAGNDVVEADLPLITEITHSYQAGVHTYVGSVLVATLCSTVSSQVVIKKGSRPERIIIVVATNGGSRKCDFEPTLRTFTLSVPGDESARVEGVALDGKFVRTAIVENGK